MPDILCDILLNPNPIALHPWTVNRLVILECLYLVNVVIQIYFTEVFLGFDSTGAMYDAVKDTIYTDTNEENKNRNKNKNP